MKAVLKRVLSTLASIPKDKLLHFFYGSIIATPLVIWGTTMEAVGFMVFISIGKEIDLGRWICTDVCSHIYTCA